MNIDYQNFTLNPVDISFGSKLILKDTKLVVKHGEHYTIVGKNGIGKTSLLNYLYDYLFSFINVTINDVIYVKQEHLLDKTISILEYVLEVNPQLIEKKKRLTELEEKDDIDDDEMQEMYDLADDIDRDFSMAKAKGKKILSGLGFTNNDIDKSVSSFSGGWQMRVYLARALFINPTILILDEPTNHLDLNASIWLTQYLSNYKNTLLVVSHDTYFIDNISNVIIEIDNHKIVYYKTNYNGYKKQKQISLNKKIKDWEKYQKKLDNMHKKHIPRKEVDAFIKKNKISRPEKDYKVCISFSNPKTITDEIYSIKNLTFGYDHPDNSNNSNDSNNSNNVNTISKKSKSKLDKIIQSDKCSTGKLFDNFSFNIHGQNKIAIVGDNGVGKTTLLKLIDGQLKPMNDNCIVDIYPNLKIGYYSQHFEEHLPLDLNGIEYLKTLDGNINLTQAHRTLSLFGLESKDHKTPMKQLSGGQKARIMLSSFEVSKPHLLLLDEPSNHLDCVALDSLIEALNNYQGAIILVSHNFDLIVESHCMIYVLNRNKLERFQGSYEDYCQNICL